MKTRLLSVILGSAFAISAIAQYAQFPFDANVTDGKKKVSSTASTSGITFVTDDKRGKVVEFDGTNGSIELVGTTAANFASCTYNIWFKLDTSYKKKWWVRVFDFGKPSDPDPGNHDVNFVTTFAFEDKLRWVIHPVTAAGGIDTILTTKAEVVADGSWKMLTCVHTKDSAKLYLNGELQQAKKTGFSPKDMMDYSKMWIGKANWNDPLFKGRMDEFTIWDKELSKAEIGALYLGTAVKGVKGSSAVKVLVSAKKLSVSGASSQTAVLVVDVTGKVIASTTVANIGGVSLSDGIYIVKVGDSVAKVLVK